jgi:predicted acylesterase/phospholipase RssA
VTWRGGFIRGQRLFDFFRGQFTDRDIAELPIPFGAVATDLATGREVWLREGKVLDAVRASVAIPGVFTPAVREGVVYVDGGLVNPVPVSMCRALGADVVIAVDLSWAKLGFYRERGRTLVPPQVPPREMPGWVKRIGSGWLDKVSGGNGNGNGNGARLRRRRPHADGGEFERALADALAEAIGRLGPGSSLAIKGPGGDYRIEIEQSPDSVIPS